MDLDSLKGHWTMLTHRTQTCLTSAQSVRDAVLIELTKVQIVPHLPIPHDVLRGSVKVWSSVLAWPFHHAPPPETTHRVRLLFCILNESYQLIEAAESAINRMKSDKNKTARRWKKIRDYLQLVSIHEWNKLMYTHARYTGGGEPYLPINPKTVDVYSTWTRVSPEVRASFPTYSYACNLVEILDSIVSMTFITTGVAIEDKKTEKRNADNATIE